MQIGKLSKLSQFPRDTIRYYEKIGLINPKNIQRTTNNVYKNYPDEILVRLQQIRFLKECGFTLQEIRHLLTGNGDYHACTGLPTKLTAKIAAIDEKISTLLAFKKALTQIEQACNEVCDSSKGIPSCVSVNQ